MGCPETAVVGRGVELSWAIKSFQSIAERGTGGGAILSFRGLYHKGRHEGSGDSSASYKKMAEMGKESGAVVGCAE
jgi:hypothetical protein